MSLLDDLKKMKKQGRYVVSLAHVISRLESIESHYYIKDDEIPAHDSKASLTINERMIREVI